MRSGTCTKITHILDAYTPTSVSSATLNIDDSVGGAGVLSANFTSASSGNYYETVNLYPSAYQNGNFGFSSFNAPTTLTGMTLNCSVVNGAYPFNTSGSYMITIANSGNTYTASTGQSGTYSYSALNRSTGMVQLNDSVTGATTAYFGFSSTTGGGYAIVNSTGYQVGNFVLLDTTSPTVSITSPTVGQRWSNSVFTVTGQANDNVKVAAVYYQILGQGWNLATTANGWSTWSGNITLTAPGTNIIQAYSVDSSGNQSVISSQTIDFVVTGLALVSINGNGTISPNYDEQQLEIGRKYSMTATAGSGCIFTNWTGDFPSASATVTFMMPSSLTMTANFIETNIPTLTITAPTAGQRMTNALATVVGTASDTSKVGSVWYQFNSNAWNAANTTNNYTNWTTASLPLMTGTNTIKAYALNLGGNYSLTNTLSFYSSNTFNLQLNFTNSHPLKSNGLVFNLHLSTGLSGHIQFSTNLTSWSTLTNFVGTNSTLNFIDPAATNSTHRYYRAAIP